MGRSSSLAALRLITLIGVLVACIFAPVHWLDAVGTLTGGDFLNYWAGPQIARDDALLLFDPAAYGNALRGLFPNPSGLDTLNWSYPLHALMLLAPFAALPYVPALLAWLLFGLVLYLACLRSTVAPEARSRALIYLLLAPVTLIEIITRQNGFFTGAGAFAALLLLERGRPIAAGVLLGLLTVKPHLFLLWPFLLLRQGAWRAIAAASITACVLIGISILLYGVAAWEAYFTVTAPYQWELVRGLSETSKLPLYALMMPSLPVSLRILHVPEGATIAAQVVLSVGVLVALLWVWRRPLPFTLRALLLAAGSLLATPYAFNYDMTFLCLVLLLRWFGHPPTERIARWREGLAMALPALVYFVNPIAPFASLLLLWVFVAAMQEALAMAPKTTTLPA